VKPARGAGTLAASVLTTAPVVLKRMAREFEASGRLDPSTAAGMYTLYVAHAALYVGALSKQPMRVRLRPIVSKAGWPMALTGAVVSARGMTLFASPAQVSGTDTGVFVTDGIYRLTRNPQYLGYVMVLGGGALVRRSGLGLLLTGAIAAVFTWWVPVEERHLTRQHGTRYEDYLRTTRRWL
jgi:protein-S-isoprenylcysteine O-methyltransferase Ste14